MCEKQFSISTELDAHIHSHKEEFPFECTICQKRVKSKEALRMHIMRMHSGETSISCEICQKKFKYSSTYQKHMKDHTGTQNSESIIDDDINSSNVSPETPFSKMNPDLYHVLDCEFICGYRTNSDILFSSTDNQLYGYNTKSVFGKAYVCTHKTTDKKRACNVRIYQVDDNKFIKLANTPAHNHPERLQEKKQLCCLNEIKRRCGQIESLLTSPSDIFKQVLSE